MIKLSYQFLKVKNYSKIFNINIISISSLSINYYGIIDFFITDKGTLILFDNINESINLFSFNKYIDSLDLLLSNINSCNCNRLILTKTNISFVDVFNYEIKKDILPVEILTLFKNNFIIPYNLIAFMKILKCYNSKNYKKRLIYNFNENFTIISNFNMRNFFGFNREYIVLYNGIICQVKYVRKNGYISSDIKKYKVYGNLFTNYISDDELKILCEKNYRQINQHIIDIFSSIDYNFFNLHDILIISHMK